MAKITAGHAVIEALVELKVKHVIGMAGSCMIEILDGMYGREDIHFLTVRHEQSAALMADAYSRLTRKPSVCMATNGPGATNLVTGVAHAQGAQSPVIVITGAPMMKDTFRDSTQELDQIAMFKPMVKWSVQARRPDRIGEIIQEAYMMSISGVPGPVHVDLPRDVMNELVDFEPSEDLWQVNRPNHAPDPSLINNAASLLNQSKKPVIIAGGGVLWSAASEKLVALAESLDAVIMTSTGRDDVVDNRHPLFLGSIGRGTIPEARELFEESDLVLAIGTRLAHSSTFLKSEFIPKNSKLIHIAVDQSVIGRNFKTDIGICSDASLAIDGLNTCLGQENNSRPDWRRRAEEVKNNQEVHRTNAFELNAKPIDPRRAHMALSKVLEPGTILTNDAGSAAGYIYEYQRFDRPHSFISPQDLAAIGVGYPLGLGAKLACPDRPVVTISGDGAFLCNGSEIETAIREGLNTVCVVLNNFNLGSERAYQKHFYDGRYVADQIGNPRFDDYARSFGAKGYRVEDVQDLEDTYSEALKQDAPVIVEVIVDQDVFPGPRRKDAVKNKK